MFSDDNGNSTVDVLHGTELRGAEPSGLPMTEVASHSAIWTLFPVNSPRTGGTLFGAQFDIAQNAS